MRILLLEPYDTGSHAAWLRGLDNADFVRAAIQQRLKATE